MQDAPVVHMQRQTDAPEETYPVFPGYRFDPLIIMVAEKDPVQHIEEVIFILQGGQQFMPQPPEEFLPEATGQRDTALGQRCRKIGAYELREECMPEIRQQNGMLLRAAVSSSRFRVAFLADREGRTVENIPTRKSRPATLSVMGMTVAFSVTVARKLGLFFFFRPNIEKARSFKLQASSQLL